MILGCGRARVGCSGAVQGSRAGALRGFWPSTASCDHHGVAGQDARTLGRQDGGALRVLVPSPAPRVPGPPRGYGHSAALPPAASLPALILLHAV